MQNLEKFNTHCLTDKPIKNKKKSLIGNLFENYYILCAFFVSFLFDMIIEICARFSVVEALQYIISKPLMFFYNVFIITVLFSVALLFKKRCFSFLLVSVICIAYIITNSVLMYYRKAPFIFADLFVLKAALDILDIYMTKFEIVVSAIAIITGSAALIWLLLKEKPKKTDYKQITAVLLLSVLATVLPSEFIIADKSKIKSSITDNAYHYGFVCCFMNSIFNLGVNKPADYSYENVNAILSETKNDFTADFTPNIVVIQLESFIDPYMISHVRYSKDPIPNFRQLKNSCSSGSLFVSVFGGGTANTEFEVLTGMNVHHFGIGEYPFETILKIKTCDSVCGVLSEYGYSSHALHNHTGTFYDRKIVYSNLGFDTFTPVEYMNNVEYNYLGWGKSTVFSDYIQKALKSTDGRDFVFTVTSQAHGKYPETYTPETDDFITVSGNDSITKIKPELEYFVNQIYDEDKWLKEIIGILDDFDEPVMAIIYGDHMPAVEMSEKNGNEGNLFRTEYVVWTNYKSEKTNKNLHTYELLPYALDTVGINGRNIIGLNQYAINNHCDCSKQMNMLEYDMLYGEKYVYAQSGNKEYKKKDMVLGLDKITIDNVFKKGDNIVVKGTNFTPSSIVYADNIAVDTTFTDSETLLIPSSDYSQIWVAQRCSNFVVLSKTESYDLNFTSANN